MQVWRKGATGPYAQVPPCRSNGTPASGPVCVDRRGLQGSSHNENGDVVMVVRATETSRWVAR